MTIDTKELFLLHLVLFHLEKKSPFVNEWSPCDTYIQQPLNTLVLPIGSVIETCRIIRFFTMHYKNTIKIIGISQCLAYLSFLLLKFQLSEMASLISCFVHETFRSYPTAKIRGDRPVVVVTEVNNPT